MNATIITIGDELLIGQVIDTNSAWMGQELNKIGISVRRRIAVGDDKSEITTALDEAKKLSDLILITGGLGPTKDDITKHTLNDYFGGKLVFNEEIFDMVKGLFEKLRRPMPDMNRLQAEVPDVCVPIKNYNGTAPGMWFERDGKVFVSMPGIPFEMKAMMTTDILPLVRKKFKTPFILHKTIHTQGIGESALAEKIKDIEEAFPSNLKLAYLPHYSLVRLRITGTGEDEMQLQEQIQSFTNQLHVRIGDDVFGYDDTSLEKVIGQILLEQKKTMSTAESCTGGLIAYKIVSVPGASRYFEGGVVAYAYEMKEEVLGVKKETLMQFGAVSGETVREMVSGALKLLKTDYAVSVSGIAGPDGATPDKPIGTVWIAVGNKENIIAKKFSFTRSREIIMEYSAITALGMLWRFLTGKLK